MCLGSSYQQSWHVDLFLTWIYPQENDMKLSIGDSVISFSFKYQCWYIQSSFLWIKTWVLMIYLFLNFCLNKFQSINKLHGFFTFHWIYLNFLAIEFYSGIFIMIRCFCWVDTWWFATASDYCVTNCKNRHICDLSSALPIHHDIKLILRDTFLKIQWLQLSKKALGLSSSGCCITCCKISLLNAWKQALTNRSGTGMNGWTDRNRLAPLGLNHEISWRFSSEINPKLMLFRIISRCIHKKPSSKLVCYPFFPIYHT